MPVHRTTELAVIALAVLFLAMTSRTGPTIAGGLGLPTPDPTRPLTAVAVLQEADCEGTVDFLRAFRRDALRGYRVVVLVPDRDPDAVERRLVDRVGPVVVEHAGRRTVRALRSLGYRRTPFLVVLDAEGRIRFSTPGDDFFARPDPAVDILGRVAAAAGIPEPSEQTP